MALSCTRMTYKCTRCYCPTVYTCVLVYRCDTRGSLFTFNVSEVAYLTYLECLASCVVEVVSQMPVCGVSHMTFTQLSPFSMSRIFLTCLTLKTQQTSANRDNDQRGSNNPISMYSVTECQCCVCCYRGTTHPHSLHKRQ